MENTTGLRESKKLRTRRQLAATALELFLERGFDAVSVADVAAAAEVSKPTLFRYFPSKEDLLLDRFADHQDEAARIVRERPAGHTPVGALHAHFLAALADRDPITGLCDHPGVLAFQRLLYGTASLQARLGHYTDREVELLAAVLEAESVPPLQARLAAIHLVAVRHELGRENWRRIDAGRSADQAHPAAVADAEQAFGMLADGLDKALPIAVAAPPAPSRSLISILPRRRRKRV
ncbi:TetR family transcriptional regulator [Streptomyces sp. MB09-01]|uniref:TetR/AcrR family transcriptional regulator n=1 Tax=Streptomyces sp. MB09-01 TaxID=3028666 RepID=UPI0029AE2819|nr:TetR family transcriptional regulator [Streptomyces sp. MB09-01]MDX3540451.1 TetR family transcriptional regulator [Streptomyces sp. MB09-01]